MASMPPMIGVNGPIGLSESPETHGRDPNRGFDKGVGDGRPNLS